MRPVGQRVPPGLFVAAKRFVFDFRDGHTEDFAGEIEPELYALLEWLAEQSMLEAENRRKPEEVGREILGYQDTNTWTPIGGSTLRAVYQPRTPPTP
jgi:hypothetical protein